MISVIKLIFSTVLVAAFLVGCGAEKDQCEEMVDAINSTGCHQLAYPISVDLCRDMELAAETNQRIAGPFDRFIECATKMDECGQCFTEAVDLMGALGALSP